jgi:hypothetical protein
MSVSKTLKTKTKTKKKGGGGSMVKIIMKKRVDNGFHDYTEWGAMYDGIIWATIYQGNGPFRKTKFNDNWFYVVRYVDEDMPENFKYEHYKTFEEAKKRAIEIAEAKIKRV